MKFVLVNGGSPYRSSVCALCGASIGNSYLRESRPSTITVTGIVTSFTAKAS
jgi:hypothetical protein